MLVHTPSPKHILIISTHSQSMVLSTGDIKECDTLETDDSCWHYHICCVMLFSFLYFLQCLNIIHVCIQTQLPQIIHATSIEITLVSLEQ